ncbi:MAG TPA: hypothetical protein VM012_04290 [Flavitalea sp.]|nr:hypothetical protein [Flavitalea sp.]
MKVRITQILILLIFSGLACRKQKDTACADSGFSSSFGGRNFFMGFTTWPFGPDYQDREKTYQFISDNADIYAEQFDTYIPWKALINNQPLPADLINDITSRRGLRNPAHKLFLSVSLLNIQRTDLLADVDGTIPGYTTMDEPILIDAYVKFVKYLVDQFQPQYLVIAMEANVLRIKQESKWAGYKSMIQTVRTKLKQDYPALKISESVTLHDWYNPQVPDPIAYAAEISDYVKQQDFLAISFYPFLKGLQSRQGYQQAFDFLHSQTTKSIAFSETGDIAENLSIPAYNVSIKGDVCAQNEYLETLLTNARNHDYEFIIWWTHRDYDELWKIFPDSTKDLGKFWRDTGLENENGEGRPSLATWKFALHK